MYQLHCYASLRSCYKPEITQGSISVGHYTVCADFKHVRFLTCGIPCLKFYSLFIMFSYANSLHKAPWLLIIFVGYS